MNKKEILEKLSVIFREVLDDDNICLDENTKLNEIAGWDSLQNIHILLSVEEEFGIRMDVEDSAEIESIDQLINVIIERV